MINRIFTIISIFFLFLFSSEAFSRTSVHKIIFKAAEPYSVAVESPNGDSNWEPGIYVGDIEVGGWKLAIRGDVLMNFRTSQALHMLSFASDSEKFEALAIINGYLTYFNIESSDEKQNYISIGSESAPLYDVVLKRPVLLPKIESISDVNIFKMSDPRLGLQLIMVSQKFNSTDPSMESGITYAFLIDFSSSEKAENFLHEPVILDRQFYSMDDLRNFVYSFKDGRIWLKSGYIARPLLEHDEGEPEFVTVWKNNVRAVVEKNNFINLSNEARIPVFDILNFKPIISSNLEVDSKVGGFNFEQNYDPIMKRAYLAITQEPSVSYSSIPKPDFVIPGNVLTAFRNDVSYTIKSDNSAYVDFYNHVFQTEDKKILVFFVDSVPYLLYNDERGLAPIRLESFPLIDKVTKFSVAQILNFISSGKDFNLMFLVSCQGERPKDGVTVLYKLRLTNSGHDIKLVDVVPINRVFYGASELRARIYGHLFDHTTDPTNDMATYRANRDPYEAHTDLLHSTSEKREYDYVEPIHFEEYGPKKEYQYKVFGKSDKPASDSGIYFRGKNFAYYKHISLGKPLLPKDPQVPYWSTAIFDGRRNKYQVYYMNVDLQHGNGERGYSSFLLIDCMDVKASDDTPAVIDLGSETQGISNLNYAMILVSDNHDSFFVLRSVTRGADDKQKNYIEVKRIDTKDVVTGRTLESVSFTLQEGPYKVLSNETYSADEVIDRILIGKGGVLYWIVTEKLTSKDPFFTIKELGMDRQIRPADSGEKLVFAAYKDYLRNGSSGSTYSAGYDKGPAYLWKVRAPIDEDKTAQLYMEHHIERLPSKSFNIFPDYLKFLEGVVHERENKKYIVVVPNELKAYVRQLTYSKLFDGADDREWTVRNEGANFYIDKGLDKVDAQKYISYLTSISLHGGPLQKSVLLVDMDTVNKYSRLKAPDSLKIKFEDIYPGADDDITSIVQPTSLETYVDPHAMYYILTEGQPVPIQDIDKPDSGLRPSYSTVIIASEEEYELMKEDLGIFEGGAAAGQPEARYRILSKFEVHQLEPPSEEAKFNIFKEILNSPDVRKVGYTFDVSSINEEVGDDQVKAEEVFINYMISRMNAEVEKTEEDRFKVLTRVFSLLKSTLLNDIVCIRNKVIDINVAEQVLGEVFDLPINLEYLPEDDPLKILSRSDIATLFQEKGGYNGFTRMDIVDTILSQTNQEPTKHIPASIILYGESGTGKTELFLALTRVLGLKIYDTKATDEYNRDAQAFILKCSKLTARYSKNPTIGSSEMMDVTTALEHLKKFLGQPLGKRGFILFDDLHATDAQTRSTLVTHIRTMLDSKTTDIIERGKNGAVTDYRTINNRNITIFVTLNPASDMEEKLSKKAGSKKDNITLFDKVIATLSDKNDGNIEGSFLRRFGLVTEMRSFPKEAKRASVADKLHSEILSNFTRGCLLIPTDSFISAIIGHFPNADARALLAGVRNGVAKKMTNIRQSGRQGSKSTIYILDANVTGNDSQYVENITTESSLINFIENNTTLYSTQSLEGQLYFTKAMADNFRNNVFDSLIYALNSSGLNPTVLQLVYLAIKHHLEGSPSIPLQKLNIDPVLYVGKDVGERAKFLKQMSMPALNGDYELSVKIKAPVSDIMSVYDGENEFNIFNLNYNYMLKIREFLKGFLGENVGVDGTNISTSAISLSSWVDKIEAKRNHRYEASFDKEFYKLFRSYFLAVDSVSFKQTSSDLDEISYYSRTRLFLSLVDQAIMNLNWGKIFNFMNVNITTILRQGELTSRHGVQEFLLKRPVSLVRTPVSDNIEVTLSQNIKQGDIQDQEIKRHRDIFYENCEDLFSEE